MLSWAAKRRLQYIGVIFAVLLFIVGTPVFFYFYDRPTCFDGEQNGDELGIDCGGDCRLYCPSQITDPVVLWSRSFEVTDGLYNTVAYVENPNLEAYTDGVTYSFELFDENNISIADRTGSTFILPGGVTPVFESSISAGERIPARTFFEFTSSPDWYRAEIEGNPLSIPEKSLINPDTSPRVNAVLENSSVRGIEDVDIIAVIFNSLGNAIAASKTVVEFISKQSTTNLVFTWPQPLSKELEACTIPVDVVLLLDASGSMNDDVTNPPQPLTDAKDAARNFVSRLQEFDQSGLVSFASEARVLEPLGFAHGETISAIQGLEILPEEESGLTNIGDAIENAVDELIPVSRLNNGEYRQVIVLLTDGRANAPTEPGGEEYALSQASIAKGRGYEIYTVGLGNRINGAFLQSIATVPEQFYQAAESRDLDRIYRQISDAICERGPAVIEVIPRSLDIIEE